MRARQGDLLIMASGARRDLDEVRPVLEALASSLVVAGENIGDGQLLKTVNQLLAGVHIAAAAEALTLAARAGLAPESALAVLLAGAGSSFMLQDRGPRMAQLLAGDQVPTHSAIELFVKDLDLVRSLADQVEVGLPVSRAAGALFHRAGEQGLLDADDSSLVRLLAGER
jgi:3-hydroxyisobutyrate dehydrogenase